MVESSTIGKGLRALRTRYTAITLYNHNGEVTEEWSKVKRISGYFEQADLKRALAVTTHPSSKSHGVTHATRSCTAVYKTKNNGRKVKVES